MKVYRLQDPNGVGPYNSRFGQSSAIISMCDKHEASRLWPNPFEEHLEFKTGNLHGFISMAQLYNWFSEEEIDMLAEFNINIEEIEAKEVCAISPNQVLFTR